MIHLHRALFFCLIILLWSSLALAYTPVQSPPIDNRQSLVNFVRYCIKNRFAEFIVNYTHGYMGTNDDLLYACNLPHIHSRVLFKNGSTTKVHYKISYYPGMVVADAYLSGNRYNLTAEQQELYDIAASIVAQARGLTPLQAELFFHDTICRQVSYYTSTPKKTTPRYATAIGVFLDRKANCQGYCDAFYMLCTMYGLEVDMQSGIASKQKHVWNVIRIDGKWYAVDVTWDDDDTRSQSYTFISHKYFNAPKEIMQPTHSWRPEDVTHEIQPYLDRAYFYCTDQVSPYMFGNYFPRTSDALDFITNQLIHGRQSLRIMTNRDDPRYDQVKFVNLQIKRVLTSARKPLSFYTILQRQGNYLYISIDVRRRYVFNLRGIFKARSAIKSSLNAA